MRNFNLSHCWWIISRAPNFLITSPSKCVLCIEYLDDMTLSPIKTASGEAATKKRDSEVSCWLDYSLDISGYWLTIELVCKWYHWILTADAIPWEKRREADISEAVGGFWGSIGWLVSKRLDMNKRTVFLNSDIGQSGYDCPNKAYRWDFCITYAGFKPRRLVACCQTLPKIRTWGPGRAS